VVTALKKADGELTATDQEAADELANCFQKIFTEEDSNGFHQVEEGTNSCWLDTRVDFSPEAFMMKLEHLPMDKAPGPDGLHPLFLRSCAVAIAEPLSLIYDRSFAAGLVPYDWKTLSSLFPSFLLT